MLSKENTDLLCRVGQGTPMGNLMRQYWLPATYGWELEADGKALRVRLLGEDLLAWRDSNGKPGFIQENCPHRGASLFYGRNEECGLRCVYHGWKWDADGQLHRHAQRAGREQFQGQDQGAELQGGRLGRHRLDLHGPGPGRPARCCPSGNGPWCPRTRLCTRTRPSTSAITCRRSRVSSIPPTSTSCIRASIRPLRLATDCTCATSAPDSRSSIPTTG